MNRKSIFAAVALAATLVAGAANAANLITFAQESQLNPGSPTFTVTNSGSAVGALNTISGAGTAQLIFTSSYPLTIPGFQIADYTFSGTSTHAATGAGLTTQQVFDSGNFTFTNGLGNLLTINFTDGLLGYSGGSLFFWMGNDPGNPNVPASSTITYSSDFDLPDLNSFPVRYGMIALTSSSVLSLGSNGGINNFQASQVGTFSAGAVPEPATWGLMIMGFGGLGAMLRTKRRALALG